MMIGQGWSFGEFLGLGRRWLLVMSCLSRGGRTFKTSLAKLTTAAVVSSSVSLTPAMRKQLRRPYCSRASCLSCRSAMLSLIWAMAASRSATVCFRDRTSSRSAPRVSSRSWLADLITRTRWAETWGSVRDSINCNLYNVPCSSEPAGWSPAATGCSGAWDRDKAWPGLHGCAFVWHDLLPVKDYCHWPDSMGLSSVKQSCN